MGVRHRVRTRRATTAGTVNLEINHVDYGPYIVGYAGDIDHETCDDTTMPSPYTVDHYLSIVRHTAMPLRFNGRLPTGILNGWDWVYHNYDPPNRAGYGYCPGLPTFDSAYWQTKALANLNPYSPKVNLPLFIYELKDIPGMLKGAGDWLKRIYKDPNIRRNWRNYVGVDATSLWLSLSLGWEPLVSDLRSMFGLAKSIENRKRYLASLEAGSHVHRKLHSGITSEYTDAALYGGDGYSARVKHFITEDIWFSANAKLKDPILGNAELQELSEKTVTGLLSEPWVVWDYLPWSWLADYFLNVGDFIEATAGLQHLEVTRLNLMAKRVHRSILEPVLVAPTISASYSELRSSEKLRVPFGHPAPSFAFTPFLTGKQMSIIGALAITRTRGKLPSGIAS